MSRLRSTVDNSINTYLSFCYENEITGSRGRFGISPVLICKIIHFEASIAIGAADSAPSFRELFSFVLTR